MSYGEGMTFHQAMNLLENLPTVLHNHEATETLKLKAINTLSKGLQFLGDGFTHAEEFREELSDDDDDDDDNDDDCHIA